MNREAFKSLIRKHEGLKLEAYRDNRGNLTIGYGHTGRNVFEGMQITLEQAESLLDGDTASAVSECRSNFKWFDVLCDMRQNVIASMVYNMGIFRIHTFKKMLEAMDCCDFETAANEMLCSKWAGEVGSRAPELAQMMREGDTVH